MRMAEIYSIVEMLTLAVVEACTFGEAECGCLKLRNKHRWSSLISSSDIVMANGPTFRCFRSMIFPFKRLVGPFKT